MNQLERLDDIAADAWGGNYERVGPLSGGGEAVCGTCIWSHA